MSSQDRASLDIQPGLPDLGSTTSSRRRNSTYSTVRSRILRTSKKPNAKGRNVRIEVGTAHNEPISNISRHGQRIVQFQSRWREIKEDLPPQLSRRHITMISIGGVIGTGVFLGTAEALRHGGPLGLLLGYSIVASIVYCVVVSIAEMISFLPNVGGIVGLADLFVDPALGFAMGWNAWYNWAIILPAEISAATVLMNFFVSDPKYNPLWTSIVLGVAVFINTLGTRWYGETEFWFAMGKVITILALFFISLYLDLRVQSDGSRIGFRYWRDPGAFAQYLDIPGAKGRFIGFWAVLMQASFSFFGAEVPGVAAGEVIHAPKNIPHAVKKIWIRIALFYIGSVFAAGLIVPHDHPDLSGSGSLSSPFVIAMRLAGEKALSKVVNAGFLTSAWSAAASDIYISSRYLYFLARCNHAPKFFGSLFQRLPRDSSVEELAEEQDDEEIRDGQVRMRRSASDAGSASPDITPDQRDDLQPTYPMVVITRRDSSSRASDASGTVMPLGDVESRPSNNEMLRPSLDPRDASVSFNSSVTGASSFDASSSMTKVRKRNDYGNKTVPWVGVLIASLVGLLAYMGSMRSSGGDGISKPVEAFNYLASMASVASLQSWICMLATYLRWHQGTSYAVKNNKDGFKDSKEWEFIDKNRRAGQPYLAIYALFMCITILIFNGWSVFTQPWPIAYDTCAPDPASNANPDLLPLVPKFITSYLPLPIFLLLFYGYKLIEQTQMVRLEDMKFTRGEIPEVVDEDEEWYTGPIPSGLSWTGRLRYRCGKVWYHLF